MANDQEPVVLELAPLPREQIGPFLLLGLDKDAGPEEIEAHWAQRVLRARRKQVRTSLSDINWAREVINDPERRVRADAASLNVDTVSGVLRGLTTRYASASTGGPAWQPLPIELPRAEYVPPPDLPNATEVREGIVLPPLPEEIPLVAELLKQFGAQSVDPWAADLLASGTDIPVRPGTADENVRPTLKEISGACHD
jgi:hypothetical protein